MFCLFARPCFASSGAFALLASIVYLCASAAYAAEFFEPRGELTLAAALSAALLRNPELQSADYAVRAADARIAQAGLRPNPELGVTLENFGGRGSLRGTSSLESTLTLSQVIELGGQRNRRIDVASFGRSAVSFEREAQQLDVLAEVTRRFIDVAEQQQQLLLARRASELTDKTLAEISQRVAAARSPEAEKSRASIALGRTRLEEKQALQTLLSAHRRLAALWGSTEPGFGDAKADLFDLPPVANFEELMAKLKSNPDFLRFANEARLRDAEWQLAKAEAKSNVTVGGGLRRFEETGDTGLVVNVSMPIPIANRNQGAIRAAGIRRDQVQVEEQAAFINAQAALFEFYQGLQQARAEVASLCEQLIPQAEAALAQTQTGYERGRFSYLELADAQRELLVLQREAIAAAATYHRLLAEIERLTNEPLAQNSF
ncbi:MAG TPA: TolC family protein [Spongiibacteraceae bacterium]|nr:TolC family protein [Spongiibacteraceae bacterium]